MSPSPATGGRRSRRVNLGEGTWEASRQAWFEDQCSALLEHGEAFNPQTQRTGTSQDVGIGSRGQIKQSKSANMRKRLRDYRQDVGRFMSAEGVPFTNNLAEQALRMAQVKQKVNLFDSLVSVFDRRTIQPCFAG